MIRLAGAAKSFARKTLFEGLDWLIGPQDRVGIVGGNGTGKSTLLKILAGVETLDSGSITRAKGVTIGYLPQEGLLLQGRSVFAECMSVFDELHGMEREMRALTRRMGELDPESSDYGVVADRFHSLESQFLARDGYALEAKTGAVLAGLGFPKQDWPRDTGEFSGGWQMRIALAKLLLERPHLLLLDEPTNHLDLEARNWLEQYLDAYPHAYLLISHDRYFLDVTTRKIIEIWSRRVHFYPGNYENYLTQKAERIAQIQAAYTNQRARIEQLETFINRFRYQATKARQVQSRIKELERMEKVEAPPPEERTIHFRFPQPKPSGRIVAEFQGVSKCYGDNRVFDNAGFTIERGDRIALVGHNGAGKSTLIRMLAGLEAVTSGSYRLGHNVLLDYFAQDQYRELDPDARLLDDISEAAPKTSQTELRNLLGCFLFSEDDVFKRIGVLSGGERNRYALARILLQPANFLLLDEPTNHLDMRAKDVLLEALQGYTGTAVFVSHDRYFLNQLATRVFEIGDGQVRIYPGNYEDYLWRVSGQPLPAVEAAAAAEEAPEPTLQPTPARRLNPIKLQKMQERQAEIEAEAGRLEAEIAALERELAVFVSAEQTQSLAASLERARARVEQLTEEWEALASSME